MGPPTRFPYLSGWEGAQRGHRLTPRLRSLLFDTPPPLTSFSAQLSVEEWEAAQIDLCLHRLHVDVVGHLHLSSASAAVSQEAERDSGGSGGSPLASSLPATLAAPLQHFRRSFFDLCAEHCEGLVSDWEELHARLTQLSAALLHSTAEERATATEGAAAVAQSSAVREAIECAVRACIRRVRREAGKEEEDEGAEVVLSCLQELQQKWKAMEEGGSQ